MQWSNNAELNGVSEANLEISQFLNWKYFFVVFTKRNEPKKSGSCLKKLFCHTFINCSLKPLDLRIRSFKAQNLMKPKNHKLFIKVRPIAYYGRAHAPPLQKPLPASIVI